MYRLPFEFLYLYFLRNECFVFLLRIALTLLYPVRFHPLVYASEACTLTRGVGGGFHRCTRASTRRELIRRIITMRKNLTRDDRFTRLPSLLVFGLCRRATGQYKPRKIYACIVSSFSKYCLATFLLQSSRYRSRLMRSALRARILFV